MQKEVIARIPNTGGVERRVHQNGNIEYVGIVAVDVNLKDILQTRIELFLQMVSEESQKIGATCSLTALPFVICHEPAFDITHGVEHLAQTYEVAYFSSGWGHTYERSRRNPNLTGDFWIELHQFGPKWWVILPGHKIHNALSSAIQETNLFFQNE